MGNDDSDDIALDALFSAARNDAPEMSDDFLNRLTADADAAVPTPPAPAPVPAPWFGTLKGWFAASGLSGAAVLGLWIGFIMPEAVSTLSFTGDETIELYTFLPGADLSAPALSE